MQVSETGRQNRNRTVDSRPWFLRSQEVTVGPLLESELRDGLKNYLFFSTDTVYRGGDEGWRVLAEHPQCALWPETKAQAPGTALLCALPPPRRSRGSQGRPVSPPLPVLALPTEPEPAPAPIPELPIEPVPALEVSPESTPAPIKIEIEGAAEIEVLLVAFLEPVIAELPPAPEAPAASIMALPASPALRRETITEPLPEPRSVPTPAPRAEKKPEPAPARGREFSDPEEADVLQAALALERALEQLPDRDLWSTALLAPSREEQLHIPSRPEFSPVFLPEPPRAERPSENAGRRVIRIELKVPERPWRALAYLALSLGALWSVGSWRESQLNKMRGPKNFRSSSPSSPTALPQEVGDPFPPLKAPARPQRE